MALKALMLRKKLTDAKAQLEEMRQKNAEFEKREAEITEAIKEAATEEEVASCEWEAENFDTERAAHDAAVNELAAEVERLEAELADCERSVNIKPAETPAEERKVNTIMEVRDRFSAMTAEQRTAIVERDEVKEFLARTRSLAGEKRAINGADLLIPEVILGLVRKEVAQTSKLLPFVNVVNVAGEGRQNILGAIPEAVWTEMCANINELTIGFNQITVDGYKVGGYIAICNATLEDSDINLADEIIGAIGKAIAKALDKAILFGTGSHMPVGIVTRLAQESQPAYWETTAPTWTDLHSTNVQTINIDSTSGAAFFASLVEKLAIAKPVYSADGLFWVMNRKTHLHIMAKALSVDANGAIVANTNQMPVVGGTIVEFEDDEIADNEIIGGYGGNYLLAQRANVKFAQSDAPLFVADMTMYKGTARYDGKPVAGEAFVIVNFANTSPTTAKTFPDDYANTAMNYLTIVAAASSSNVGKTVLTVTDYLASESPTLKYKVGKYDVGLNVGDAVVSWTSLTSGTTEITAAAGKAITVVELDGNNKVVSVGVVASVPKAS